MNFFLIATLALTLSASAKEFHVATNGSDASPGTKRAPFRTIQRAADAAQPGDVVTVHAGIYRERVTPPRGGTSDKRRIVYQAAPGEKVVITGSEPLTNWVHVSGDTWKATLPNSFFGQFNPFAEMIHGDWFEPLGRSHHLGAVYRDGHWLTEAPNLNEVLKPAGASPLWFARVDGVNDGSMPFVLNLVSFKPGAGETIRAEKKSGHKGTSLADSSEGGKCVGHILNGNWLRFDAVNFGEGSTNISFRTAAIGGAGGIIEVRLDHAQGELLGVGEAPATGDWQKWENFTATIRPTSGARNICLVFRWPPPPATTTDNTTIWAQFPGVNPNAGNIEINVRPTVFSPAKTGVNFLTLRGFTLRNAATQWAPPTAGQFGLVSAYWCKGWIIEQNDIGYSICSGIALGKYRDEFDNTSADSAEGYVATLRRALKNGWNQATVGSHVVRSNRIHHCEQTGIVGSLGCSFSTVTDNEIHDIHVRQLFHGAETAGIKFHGAIDVVIARNHIWRCGNFSGIWLDWMAQGAQVRENLLHDNFGDYGDVFLEMQHGPLLVANNLFLSPKKSFTLNAKGVAFAHNLIVGPVESYQFDPRETPFHPAHSTEIAGLKNAESGDHRFLNNLFAGTCNLGAINNAMLDCVAAGNVFTKGNSPSKFDTNALVKNDFEAGIKLEQRADGWQLTLAADPAWRAESPRQRVTTERLGLAKIPQLGYLNRDGSPLFIATDYFGKKRDAKNPFPGPFEISRDETNTFKVWRGGVK